MITAAARVAGRSAGATASGFGSTTAKSAGCPAAMRRPPACIRSAAATDGIARPPRDAPPAGRRVTAAASAAQGFGSITGASEPKDSGMPIAASAPAGYRWGRSSGGTVAR